MNILDKKWEALSDEEFATLQRRYTRNLSNLSYDDAMFLLKSFISMTTSEFKNSYDINLIDLMLRHLHGIIDWTTYPERLL
jgi:hypothetical protein